MENKKVLLWLEDRINTIAQAAVLAEELGFTVIIVPTLNDFAERLNSFKDQIKVIALDIMVYNQNNLSSLGLPNISTESGTETGWAIIKHFLLADNSEYSKKHIAIISSRPLYDDTKVIYKDYLSKPNIKYFEKGSIDWIESFSQWLRSV